MIFTLRKAALTLAAACALPALAAINDVELKNVSPKAGELDIELRSLEQITLTFNMVVNVREGAVAYLLTPEGKELTSPIVRNEYLPTTCRLNFPDINYFNGDYTLTIKRWSVGDDEWLADYEQGHTNSDINVKWTVTNGLQPGAEYDIRPVSILPANNAVFTYPAKPLTAIQITMPGGTIMNPRFEAHLSNVETRYANTLTFVAEDKGKNVVYTAEVSPPPSIRGDYTLVFPAGMFGDEEYIRESKGHASPELMYQYSIEPSDPDATGDEETVSYTLQPSGMKLEADGNDYTLTWRWGSGTLVNSEALAQWRILDGKGYAVDGVNFSFSDTEDPAAGIRFTAALQPEEQYILLVPGAMFYDKTFADSEGLLGTANPQLRYDFVPTDITSGVAASEADATPAKRTVYTAQGIRLHEDATDAQIRALAPGLYIIAGKKVMVK